MCQGSYNDPTSTNISPIYTSKFIINNDSSSPNSDSPEIIRFFCLTACGAAAAFGWLSGWLWWLAVVLFFCRDGGSGVGADRGCWQCYGFVLGCNGFISTFSPLRELINLNVLIWVFRPTGVSYVQNDFSSLVSCQIWGLDLGWV